MAILGSNLSRRQVFGLGGIASVAAFGLAACGGQSADAPKDKDAGSAVDETVQIDAKTYDGVISAGNTADDAAITANSWAKKIKDAGEFRVGGVDTSTLFALRDPESQAIRGFDAGLYQLLTRYILGDESKVKFTQVTSDTRESLLQNDNVDAVFATYSITDERKKLISFAGPYYESQQGILVAADNADINGIDDLAGKNVAAQSGSTGPSILEKEAPKANVQEYKTDEEARRDLEQGRVDAYVIDMTMQISSMAKNPGKYRIAGDAFGPVDAYGIGLPKDSDGVQFVNGWLKAIEDDGTWEKLWKVCIGDRTDIKDVPTPPAIGA